MADEAGQLAAPCVYLLLCADGSYYAGWTADLAARLRAHRGGSASRYTRTRRPVRLAYCEECANRTVARRREAALKNLGHAAKAQLCDGFAAIGAAVVGAPPVAGEGGES